MNMAFFDMTPQSTTFTSFVPFTWICIQFSISHEDKNRAKTDIRGRHGIAWSLAHRARLSVTHTH